MEIIGVYRQQTDSCNVCSAKWRGLDAAFWGPNKHHWRHVSFWGKQNVQGTTSNKINQPTKQTKKQINNQTHIQLHLYTNKATVTQFIPGSSSRKHLQLQLPKKMQWFMQYFYKTCPSYHPPTHSSLKKNGSGHVWPPGLSVCGVFPTISGLVPPCWRGLGPLEGQGLDGWPSSRSTATAVRSGLPTWSGFWVAICWRQRTSPLRVRLSVPDRWWMMFSLMSWWPTGVDIPFTEVQVQVLREKCHRQLQPAISSSILGGSVFFRQLSWGIWTAWGEMAVTQLSLLYPPQIAHQNKCDISIFSGGIRSIFWGHVSGLLGCPRNLVNG